MSAHVFEKGDLRAALFCAKGLSLEGSSVVIAHDGQLIVVTPDDDLPAGVDVDLHLFDDDVFHHADRRVIAAFQYSWPTYYTTSPEIAHEQALRRSSEGRRRTVVVFKYGRIAEWRRDCTLGRPDLFAVVDANDSLLEEVQPDQIIATYVNGRVRPNLWLVPRSEAC